MFLRNQYLNVFKKKRYWLVFIFFLLVLLTCFMESFYIYLTKRAYQVECRPYKQTLLPYEPLLVRVEVSRKSKSAAWLANHVQNILSPFYLEKPRVYLDMMSSQGIRLSDGQCVISGASSFFPDGDSCGRVYMFDIRLLNVEVHSVYPAVVMTTAKERKLLFKLPLFNLSTAKPIMPADLKLYSCFENGLLSPSSIYDEVRRYNVFLIWGEPGVTPPVFRDNMFKSSIYIDYCRRSFIKQTTNENILCNLRLIQPDFPIPLKTQAYFSGIDEIRKLFSRVHLSNEEKHILLFRMCGKGETIDAVYDFQSNQLTQHAYELIKSAPQDLVDYSKKTDVDFFWHTADADKRGGGVFLSEQDSSK